MAARVGRLQSYVPYWTTLKVPVKRHPLTPQGWAAVLVLKDGTLAVGLVMEGVDLYAAGHAVLNHVNAAISKALRGLPSGSYVQAVFETGTSFDSLIDAFGAQGAKDAIPIVRRGRELRARAFRDTKGLTRPDLTYWIGWKEATKGLFTRRWPAAFPYALRKLFAPDPKDVNRDFRRAAQLLLDAAAKFSDTLAFGGLKGRLLDQMGLLAACHRALNPTSYRRYGPPRYIETAQDVKEYQAGGPLLRRGPALASQLCLGPVAWNPSHLVVGHPPVLVRALGVARLSDETTPKSLYGAMFEHQPQEPFRLVITHTAVDKMMSLEDLRRRRRWARALMGSAGDNEEAKNAYADRDAAIKELTGRDARLFETRIVALVHGQTEYDLDDAATRFFDGLQAHNIVGDPMCGEQWQSWLGALPANGYRLARPMKLLDRSCAHLTPIWRPTLGDAEPELLFRNRQRGLQGLSVRLGPVREHAGAVVLGSVGSGKTFLVSHLFKDGCLSFGGHVILVDVKGPDNSSYKPLCDLLGGRYMCLQNDPEASCSPFPPVDAVVGADGAVCEAILEPSVLAVCLMAMDHKRQHLDRDYWESAALTAIKHAYRVKQAACVADPTARKTPILQDVIDAIQLCRFETGKQRSIAKDLESRLGAFLHTELRRRLFNQPKDLSLDNALTVFDFFGMEKDERAATILMAALASRIEVKLRSLPKTVPKMIIWDEAWRLLEDSKAGRDLVGMMFRIARSYGAFCYVVTQHEDDIRHSGVGQAVLSNSSLRFFLRRIDGHEQTAEVFRLSERHLELTKSLKVKPGPYAEFLLVDTHEGRTQVLQYWPTPYDYWCDTSRPADVEMRNQRMRQSDAPLREVIEALAVEYPTGAPGAQRGQNT